MATVLEQATEFCVKKSMEAPTKQDLSAIGSAVRQHFNFFYMKKNGLRGIIEGAGFMRVKEGNMAVIVNFYPDEFVPEMWSMIDLFYAKKAKKADEKNKRMAEEVARAAKPKRPRIPANQPVWKRR